MDQIIFLDTGPLGFITHPNAKQKSSDHSINQCLSWFKNQLLIGKRICIPEICDYELRRSLLNINSSSSLQKLNDLKHVLEYVPISTSTMIKAAELWADSRKNGFSTSDDLSLDGDVILCAQAITYGSNVVIATTNLKHLSRYANAKLWSDIK